MGKRARNRTRSADGKTPRSSARPNATAVLAGPELHVTVATLPSHDFRGSLRHDAVLVKSALLYADRVTLASPNAAMLASMSVFTTPDSDARRAALVAAMAAVSDGEDAMAVYEALSRRRKRLSPQERVALIRIERALQTSGGEMAEVAHDVLDQAGMPELQLAMEAGVLDIHMLDLGAAAPGELGSRVIDGFAKVLADAVSGRARTYPMFDDGSGSLVASMIAEGHISDIAPSHGKQIGAAGLLIGQLEAFPDAEMDVVLDVRGKLSVPLTRFRASLAEASAEFESPSWQTSEFAREVDDLYHRRVAPALLDLEEAMQQLGARPTLRRMGSDGENTKVAAAIAVTAVAGMELCHLPQAIFGGGSALAAVGASAAREAQHRAELRREQRSNEFYFLYEADRRLRGPGG